MTYESITRKKYKTTLETEIWEVNGQPTCLSWWGGKGHDRECCMFLGTYRMGSKYVCMAIGEQVHEYLDGPAEGFLKPALKCVLCKER